MTVPYKVLQARDRGDQKALRRMRLKAASTRARNNLSRARLKDEQQAIDDLHKVDPAFEAFLMARERHDHLLPEDD